MVSLDRKLQHANYSSLNFKVSFQVRKRIAIQMLLVSCRKTHFATTVHHAG